MIARRIGQRHPVFSLVPGSDQSGGPKNLDPLIIAIGCAAAVRDDRLPARCRAQNDVDAVKIPQLADCRIRQHGCRRQHGFNLFPQQPARHVEVMDRHVAEYPARAGDVIGGRRAGITADDGDHFDRPDAARVNGSLQRHEIRVEPAVEPDHQLALLGRNHFQAGLHAGQRQINRLFAEHGLAGADKPFDQVGMGVCGGADHHCVHIVRPLDHLDRADVAAIGGFHGLGGRCHRIGNRDKPCIRRSGDSAGMHLADAASPEDGKIDSHDVFPCLKLKARSGSGRAFEFGT